MKNSIFPGDMVLFSILNIHNCHDNLFNYFAGSGYGCHHIVYMALRYPSLVKGLILLNPAQFGHQPAAEKQSKWQSIGFKPSDYEIIANLQASGFLHLGEQLGIFSLESILDDYVNFTLMTADIKTSLTSSIRSGYYFPTQVRENNEFYWSEFAEKELTKDIEGKTTKEPTLLIQSNKGKAAKLWFPVNTFSRLKNMIQLEYNHPALIDQQAKLISQFIENEK